MMFVDDPDRPFARIAADRPSTPLPGRSAVCDAARRGGRVATLDDLRSRYPDKSDEAILGALEAVSAEAGVAFTIEDDAVWVRR